MPLRIRDYRSSDFSTASDWTATAISEMQRQFPDLIPPEEQVAKPTRLDLAAAGWRRENIVSSAADSLRHMGTVSEALGVNDDPNYNGLEDMPVEFAAFADDFAESGSPRQTELLIHDLTQERRDLEWLDSAGWEGIGWQFAATIADPSMMTPALWAAKLSRASALGMRLLKGSRTARAAKIGGAAALSEMTAAGMAEIVLQSTQYERAWQESLMNIGGAGILAGVVGTAGGAFTRGQNAHISRAITDSLKRDKATVARDQMPTGLKLADIAESGERVHIEPKMARVVFGPKQSRDRWFTSWMTPLMRLQNSRNPRVVALADSAMNHRLMKKANLEGEASVMAAETEIRQMQRAMFTKGKRRHDEAFKALRKKGYDMNRRTFNREVTEAIKQGKHEIDEIAVAARAWQEEVLSPMGVRQTRAGMIKEATTDLEKAFKRLFGSTNYFPRVYRQSLIGSDPEFHALLTSTYYGRGEEMSLEIAQSLASDTIRTLRHAPTGRLPNEFLEEKGLDMRSLLVSDERLRPWLVDDVEEVMQDYLYTNVPDLVLTERYGGFTWKKQFDQIQDVHDDMMKDLKNPKDRARLVKEHEADIDDLTAMRDRLRGMDGPPADSAALTFNTVVEPYRATTSMTYLGFQPVSALPDIASVIWQQGFGPTLRAFGSMLTESGFHKLDKEYLAGIGIGAENITNARTYALTYQRDVGQSKSSAGSRIAISKFAQVTGMNAWNSGLKRLAGAATQTKIINAGIKLTKGKWVSKALRTQLASVGLDEDALKRIGAQALEHGTESRYGGWIGNTANWTDAETANLFELVTMREVETTIVTPGVGDRPVLASHEAAKVLLQFKSFFLAAQNQILIPNVQRLVHTRDGQVVLGMLSMGLMGFVGGEVRNIFQGKPSNFKTMEPQDLVKLAIDNSGMLAMWPTGFDMLDQFSQGALSDSMSLTPSWRATQAPTFAKSVPALGLAERQARTLANLPGQLMDKEFAEAGNDMWRVLPFQNLFYTQWIFDEAFGRHKAKRPKKRKVR